jgi:hypothetical protein
VIVLRLLHGICHAHARLGGFTASHFSVNSRYGICARCRMARRARATFSSSRAEVYGF